MRFGVDLGRCNPRLWLAVAGAADRLGFESVWIPEHLVFPTTIAGSPSDQLAHGTVDPFTPTFDPFVVLGAISAVAPSVRLGTHVYNIGLRHPFVTARAAATLDVFSQGRLELGIGASWLEEEWDAVGLDFATRGRRVDESIDICRQLWRDRVVEHAGEFFEFGPVAFEPKPVQQPLPLHIGGDSLPALRRAARTAQGWIGMIHTPESFAVATATLRQLCVDAGRPEDAVMCTALGGHPSASDVDAWRWAGCGRLIVAPWARSADALDGLRTFATAMALHPRA